MDSIFIRDLKVEAIVGIFPWERAVPQQLELNIEMAWDIAPAAASCRIEDALDYSAVANAVKKNILEGEYLLLETMAESLVELIMTDFSVPWLSLSITKTQAMADCHVGVKVVRGQRGRA